MQKIKKILVTGSNGMLGKDLVDFLKSYEFDLYGLNRKRDYNLAKDKSILCDLVDFEKLNEVLNTIDPDIIIHCAAIVDVDLCEKDKKLSNKINVESTKQLALYKPEITKFIYISSDSVFCGQKGNYKEDSKKDPINYYAKTKSLAEDEILTANNNHIIIRTNIYGFHKEKGKSLVEWALGEVFENRKIKGFDDVYFNPVYTMQLSKVIYDLVIKNFTGTINIGSNKALSKYEFLLRVLKTLQLKEYLIEAISVEQGTLTTLRPKNTTLNTTFLKETLNYEIDIFEGIEELVRDYKNRSSSYE